MANINLYVKKASVENLYYNLFKTYSDNLKKDQFDWTEDCIVNYLCGLSLDELDNLDSYILSIRNRFSKYNENINEISIDKIFNRSLNHIKLNNLTNQDIKMMATSEYFHHFVRIIRKLRSVYNDPTEIDEFLNSRPPFCYIVSLVHFMGNYCDIRKCYSKVIKPYSEDEKLANKLFGDENDDTKRLLAYSFKDNNKYTIIGFAIFLNNLIEDSFNKEPQQVTHEGEDTFIYIDSNSERKASLSVFEYETNLRTCSDIVYCCAISSYDKGIFSYDIISCMQVLKDLDELTCIDSFTNEPIHKMLVSSVNLINAANYYHELTKRVKEYTDSDEPEKYLRSLAEGDLSLLKSFLLEKKSPFDNVKNSERLIDLIDFVIDEKKKISDVKDIYEKLCSLYSDELYCGECKKYLDSIGINQLLLLAQLLKKHALSDDFEEQDEFYKRIDSHVRKRVGKYYLRGE